MLGRRWGVGGLRLFLLLRSEMVGKALARSLEGKARARAGAI